MMKEEWKSIAGYEGYYEVSNIGRAKSLPRLDNRGRKVRGKDLIAQDNGSGYRFFCLCKNGKKSLKLVHRVVFDAFVGFDQSLEIDHVDGNKSNNKITNLRALTRAQNTRSYLSIRKSVSSEFRGVYFYKAYRKWSSIITLDGQRHFLGYFENEEEAALIYNEKATELGFNKEALNRIQTEAAMDGIALNPDHND